MKSVMCLLLIFSLFGSCTSDQINLVKTIIGAAEAIVPLIPTQNLPPEVTVYISNALKISYDLLSNSSDPMAIQKALAEFNALIVPEIANINPKAAKLIYSLSIAIGTFVTSYSTNAIKYAVANGKTPKLFYISQKDQKAIFDLLVRIRADQEKIALVTKK